MNVTLTDTLYHFTKFDALRAILKSRKFLVSLNTVQWFSTDQKGYFFKIPMACFSETPLEFMKDHKRNFGEYGLGMKIQWAIGHGLHNVIYVDMLNPSNHGIMITEILKYYFSVPATHKPHLYHKNLNDQLVGSSELMKYRDEREWRFIGKINDYMSYTFTPDSISFDFTDVAQIVCPKKDVDELIRFLKDEKMNDCIGLIHVHN